MNKLIESVNRIKNGIPYDVVIESLLESKELSPEYWRQVLMSLSRNVKKGQTWLGALQTTANEWTGLGKSKSRPTLNTSDIVKFLLTHKILDNAKRGMRSSEITTIFSKLAGPKSELELDTYWHGKDPKRASKTTQRMRHRRGSTKRLPKSKDDND